MVSRILILLLSSLLATSAMADERDAATIVKEAIESINHHINKKTILISIMAGVSIKKLIKLSGHKKIVRMMPNLGLSVGEGIAVWKTSGLSVAEIKTAKNFINKITEITTNSNLKFLIIFLFFNKKTFLYPQIQKS